MIKKIALALAVLLLLAAGTVGWLWHQATALPEWYTEGADLAEYGSLEGDSDGPIAPPQWIALDEQGNRLPAPPPPVAPPATSPSPEAARTPPARAARPRPPATAPGAKRHELRGFHRRPGKRSSPAIKASRATYQDHALEIGVILDIGRLPRDKLNQRDRGRYDRAVENFPGLTKRDVWVGVSDSPITVGGYLQLSPDAEVRVGKLSYSLAGAARRLGMSEYALRLELNRELRRLGFVDPEA